MRHHSLYTEVGGFLLRGGKFREVSIHKQMLLDIVILKT